MKKALFALVIAALAGSATAAQLVEAIVIRVGDRVVTRTQYLKRLHDGFNEIEPRWGVDENWANPVLFGAHYVGEYSEGRGQLNQAFDKRLIHILRLVVEIFQLFVRFKKTAPSV